MKWFLLIIFQAGWIFIPSMQAQNGNEPKNDFIPNKTRHLLTKWDGKSLASEKDSSTAIRLWLLHSMLELHRKEDSTWGILMDYARKTEEPYDLVFEKFYIQSAKAKRLMDTLINLGIMNLPDGRGRGIDGTDYVFEVRQNGHYRFYTYWSPHGEDNPAAKIWALTYRNIPVDSLDSLLVRQLSPGEYMWSPLVHFRVDGFCEDSVQTSSLYRHVEKILRHTFHIHKKTDPPAVSFDNVG